MDNSTYKDEIDFIDSTNVYLSQEILNISNIFMQKAPQYNHYMRIYIYILTEVWRNSSSNITVIKFTSKKLQHILGRYNSHISLAETQTLITDFKQFINSEDMKRSMKSTSNLLLNGYYKDRTVEIEVNNRNNVAQRLIRKDLNTMNNKRFVMFRFDKMNYKSSSKFYLYFFLLFAGYNKIHVNKMKIDSIKQMLNMSPKSTSTRVRKIVDSAIETLSLSFTNMRAEFTPKKKDKAALLTFKWSKYNSGINEIDETVINENGNSFINVSDMSNVFFENWNPENIHDVRKYIPEIYQYISEFESKHKTHITNYSEVFQTMFDLLDDNISEQSHIIDEDTALLEALNNNNTNENGDIF